MLDQKSNVRDDMIDRYLRDTLPGEERAQVELWMLEDPEFYDRVCQAELMLRSFSHLENPAPVGTIGSAKTRNHGLLGSFQQWISQPLSIAASLLLAVATTLLISSDNQPPGTTTLSNGLALNTVTTLQATRSTGTEIQLTGGTQLLQIDVGITLGEAPYQVELTHEDGNPHFEFQLNADANGMVRFLTPADLEGRFLLSVQQAGSDQSGQTYMIEFNG